MASRSVVMGEAKKMWMEAVLKHPGKHPDDAEAIRKFAHFKEPNTYFRDSLEMGLLGPYIERWAESRGLSIVHI